MKRVLLGFLVGALLALAAFAFWGDPGRASAEWLGWRIDASATTVAAAILTAAVLVALLLAAAGWLGRAPARRAEAREEARRRERLDAVSKGFLALAAGDAAEARRLALRVQEGLDRPGALARLLAAQSAEAVGDSDAAILAYEAMLSSPETKAAGRRGLMGIARRLGDDEAAQRHAKALEVARAAEEPLTLPRREDRKRR
jgi:HemY protein